MKTNVQALGQRSGPDHLCHSISGDENEAGELEQDVKANVEQTLSTIAACVGDRWSPQIGDPTVAGWGTVVAHAVCAVLGFFYNRCFKDQSSRWQQITAVPEMEFEMVLAAPDKPTTNGITAAAKSPKRLWRALGGTGGEAPGGDDAPQKRPSCRARADTCHCGHPSARRRVHRGSGRLSSRRLPARGTALLSASRSPCNVVRVASLNTWLTSPRSL